MKTLTVFCCGTAFDESNRDELVAKLATQMKGRRWRDWIIFAGPGSTGFVATNYDPLVSGLYKGAKTSTEEALKATAGGKSLLEWVKTGIVWSKDYTTGSAAQAAGLALGYGMAYNTSLLLRAVTLLQPDKINMIGWSRGACTCHMMANRLFALYQNKIMVNIFSIDPVPGPFNFKEEILAIPQDVHWLKVILMENEPKPGFSAAHVKVIDRGYTDAVYMSLPGTHSNPVIPAADPAEKAVYTVVSALAEHYLAEWGTNLDRQNCRFESALLLEDFSFISINLRHFEGLARRIRYVGGLKEWTPVREVVGRDQPARPWINYFHLLSFKQYCPEVYNFIRLINGPQAFFIRPRVRGGSQFLSERHRAAFRDLRDHFPHTHQLITENYFDIPVRLRYAAHV